MRDQNSRDDFVNLPSMNSSTAPEALPGVFDSILHTPI